MSAVVPERVSARHRAAWSVFRRHNSLRRVFLDALLEDAKPLMTGKTIDLGGKKTSKRGVFRPPLDADWIYVNLEPATAPDVIGDAHILPLRSGIADCVVCCEVIEHLSDPVSCLAEVRRVLRPGGYLILSVPFLFPIHGDPSDYWRMTPDGLRTILPDFEVKELHPMGGWLGTTGMLVDLGARRSMSGAGVHPLLSVAAFVGRSLAAFDVLRAVHSDATGLTSGYFCIAVKKAGPRA